jgi:hypothetical protein
MNKKYILSSILVIVTLVLAGCQTSQVASAASQLPQGTPPAGFNPRQAAAVSATPTATATALPTATATATAQPVTAAAESSARAYFAALSKSDFSSASQLVSIFSLSFAQMTRSDAASKLSSLSKAGTTWSDLQIVGSQVFNDSVILVHVTYRTGSTATATATPASQASATPAAATNQKDELWPFRLENGQWLYNWNNLIDYKSLVIQSQVREHITIKPSQLVRYSDRIELHFMMQNQTSDVVYFVQSYDSLAVFHFGDQAVEADKTRPIVISGLRTSFDEVIVVKGLYTSYPNWVEIRKWKGYAPNPWYTFQF